MALDMNTTPATTFSEAFAADPLATLRDFIGGPAYSRESQIPALDAEIAVINDSGVFTGLESREAYLAWVADYKLLVNATADHVRSLKKKRKDPETCDWKNESEIQSLARSVTLAIRLRRLGKRWSAAQREAQA